MPTIKLIEKPGGARNVQSWDVHTERAYRPLWYVDNKTDPAGCDPTSVVVRIGVQFWDDESAREFEAKVRAMLPEVAC